MEIDFRNIKEYDGSKDKGFEELVCQLAHLDIPDNAFQFVRKEGDGGDAGIECYWKLSNGDEYAWQAKYFLESFSNNQWSQINDSVTTAINKHANLKKYYVCIPRDWTDSRKTVKGQTVNSAFDKWQQYITEWTEYARSKNMSVEFLYWGKHEICNMLQTDSPIYSGKLLYWFNTPSLNTEKLLTIAERSKISLGERFTPEFNVELPIAKEFDGLGLTMEWYNNLDAIYQSVDEATSNIVHFLEKNSEVLEEAKNNGLLKNMITFKSAFEESVISNNFIDFHKLLSDELEKILKILWGIQDQLVNETRKVEQSKWEAINSKRYELRQNLTKLEEVSEFLTSRALKLAMKPIMLLLGEAGIGKSHLLCDIALKRLKDKMPTLFLLGQHYPGGNPLDYMKSELGISSHSDEAFLGSLDTFGESKKSRFMIFIDAINEGKYKEEWYEQIVNIILKIERFENIGIVFSCRSTYKDFLIPKELNDKKLTIVYHKGFTGYEHRAAVVFLANYGITVPNAPIMNPEFSNPLFLKTCCKAIRNNGETSFPKGLNGFINLYHFYIASVDDNIKRLKKCRKREDIVLKALYDYVNNLYPNNVEGLEFDRAKECINKYDPNSSIDESLLELLLDEGVLSTDVLYSLEEEKGKEVIRFTYERFCDFAIAEHIMKDCNDISTLEKCFRDGEISKVTNYEKSYKYSGVIEALGIIIPERFQREFIEFYEPNDKYDEYWIIERTFKNTILWRTGTSISDKSLELLNKMNGRYYNSLTILLSLAIEPEHPWNANFLNKNLSSWDLNDRDSRWSTFVAADDYSDEENYESVVRKLIDWAFYYDLKDVDESRLWLTALVLSWLTSTSNRRTRDQATKSLSKVMILIPKRIISLLELFADCDDLYVLQRLHAAIYGAITQIDNSDIIKVVSEYIVDKHFSNDMLYPDILFRDYICGIIEYATAHNVTSCISKMETIRPPFKSEWPIDNPKKSELDELFGDDFSSSIKSSIMGFPGDFGNYTMGCVHNWAAGVNKEGNPKSGIEEWKSFKQKLPQELHKEYDEFIKYELRKSYAWQTRDIHEWLEKMTDKELEDILKLSDSEEDYDEEVDALDLEQRIKESLDEASKEEFRWLSGIRIDEKPAPFSRKWAQRWVCKKAYSLGWKRDLFDDFESIYSNGRSHRRMGGKVERIGKKYQWIALHELLARMSDNLIWIDRGYSDVDDEKYYGPWQIHRRDIDPTLFLRKTQDDGWLKNIDRCWWQPYRFTFTQFNLEDLQNWLWSKTNVPDFKDILCVVDSNNVEWLILKGSSNWNKKPLNDKDTIPYQDAWYRINSCIVHDKDFNSIIQQVKGKSCASPDVLGSPSTGHQGYYGEYPWHSYYSYIEVWQNEIEIGYHINFNEKYHIPVCEYEWEKDVDHSIDSSISFYLPSPYIIDKINLKRSNDEVGVWKNEEGEVVFYDPSIYDKGPSYALIRKDYFESWLRENNLRLLYLVGGEKQLFTEHASEFFGRHVYSGAYSLQDGQINGEIWFVEEKSKL